MTTCPKCGYLGADDQQCGRCGIIFERMHTVLDHTPVGSLAEAARRANQVARTLGVTPVDRSEAPTEEVSTVDLRALRNPEVTAPPVVTMVPRSQPRRRTWLLVTLLLVTGLLLVDQLHDRKQVRQRRAEAAALAQRPAVDATYLDLAFETMLSEARSQLRRVDDPAQASATLEELLTRVSDLEKRLGSARIDASGRGEYEEVLMRLREFLQQDARPAITAAAASGARPEPVSIRSLEEAEAAFERARSAR